MGHSHHRWLLGIFIEISIKITQNTPNLTIGEGIGGFYEHLWCSLGINSPHHPNHLKTHPFCTILHPFWQLGGLMGAFIATKGGYGLIQVIHCVNHRISRWFASFSYIFYLQIIIFTTHPTPAPSTTCLPAPNKLEPRRAYITPPGLPLNLAARLNKANHYFISLQLSPPSVVISHLRWLMVINGAHHFRCSSIITTFGGD